MLLVLWDIPAGRRPRLHDPTPHHNRPGPPGPGLRIAGADSTFLRESGISPLHDGPNGGEVGCLKGTEMVKQCVRCASWHALEQILAGRPSSFAVCRLLATAPCEPTRRLAYLNHRRETRAQRRRMHCQKIKK